MTDMRGIRLGRRQAEVKGRPYDDLLFAKTRNEELRQQCIKNHFFQELFENYGLQRREGECDTVKEREEEILNDQTSIYFNESNINLRKGEE